MKKTLIFILIILLLAGCNQKNNNINSVETENENSVEMENEKSEKNKNEETIEMEIIPLCVKGLYFETLELLEENSEAIAIVTPTGERENIYKVTKEHHIPEVCRTLTEVKVERLISGELPDKIKLSEYYFVQTGTNRKHMPTDSAPMRDGESYLVFLQKLEDTHELLEGSYCTVGVFEGRINISEEGRKRDLEFLKTNFSSDKKDILDPVQKEALKKYIE